MRLNSNYRSEILIVVVLFMTISEVFGQTKFKSLNFLYQLQDTRILSGQHNDQKDLECGNSGSTNAIYWSNEVLKITGKNPALYSADFLFHGKDSLRWEIVFEAEKQWTKGAIINLMWHACPPNSDKSCNWNGGVLSSLDENEWQSLLKNGGTLNTAWKAQVDEIAIYLKYLKNKGVEVLWRPYHEQNQRLFWWNSQGYKNTKKLWRMLHNYLTKKHKLTNLIWVWDLQDIDNNIPFKKWNPGSKYWDVMALDIYDDAFTNDKFYNQMIEIAGRKPIAIGECFRLPSREYLDSHPKFSFFMTWAYGLRKGLNCEITNTEEEIKTVYSNPDVLTLEEMPGWNN